jgi:hypothetical protein
LSAIQSSIIRAGAWQQVRRELSKKHPNQQPEECAHGPIASSRDGALPRRANVAVAQDPAGNLKPAKDKSTERIDGIVATIMAIGRALVARKSPSPSIRCSLFE